MQSWHAHGSVQLLGSGAQFNGGSFKLIGVYNNTRAAVAAWENSPTTEDLNRRQAQSDNGSFNAESGHDPCGDAED